MSGYVKLNLDSTGRVGKFEGLGEHASKLPSLALLKTHKTGSSTLINILHRLGDRRNMSFMVPPIDSVSYEDCLLLGLWLGWPSGFPGHTAVEQYGPPARQFDIIVNHAVFDKDAFRGYLKDDNPHIVAIARDPLSQAVSAKDFFMRANMPWDDHIESLQAMDPLANFRACNEKRTSSESEQNCSYSVPLFVNSQAYDMGWYAFAEKAGVSGEGNSSLVAEWLKTLDRELSSSSIVLTEHFNEGLVLMRQKLGCDLAELSYVKLNVQSVHGDPPSTFHLGKLRKINAVDIALYDHLNKTFWKEWEAGDHYMLKRELAQLERMNADLDATCGEDNKSCAPEFGAESCPYEEALGRKQKGWGLKLAIDAPKLSNSVTAMEREALSEVSSAQGFEYLGD